MLVSGRSLLLWRLSCHLTTISICRFYGSIAGLPIVNSTSAARDGVVLKCLEGRHRDSRAVRTADLTKPLISMVSAPPVRVMWGFGDVLSEGNVHSPLRCNYGLSSFIWHLGPLAHTVIEDRLIGGCDGTAARLDSLLSDPLGDFCLLSLFNSFFGRDYCSKARP